MTLRAALAANSDGVVPLSSQLHAPAQMQSHAQLGLNLGHVGIRDVPEAIDTIMAIVAAVQTGVPQDHMLVLRSGGYEVEAEQGFSDRDRWQLRTYGRYLLSLAQQDVVPMNEGQRQLVRMLRGEVAPSMDEARLWLRFLETEQGRAVWRSTGR